MICHLQAGDPRKSMVDLRTRSFNIPGLEKMDTEA